MPSKLSLQELDIYHSLIDHSDTLFSSHDLSGVFTYVSPNCFSLLGYCQEDLLGICLHEFVHPNDQQLLSCLTIDDGFKAFQFRLRKKEGDYIWVDMKITPLKKHGHVIGFSALSYDSTDRVAMEIKLQESKNRYEQLVENSIDTVGIMDKDGIWIYINEAGIKLFGVTGKDEIIGKSAYDFMDDESSDFARKKIDNRMGTEPFDLTVRRHDFQKKYTQVQLIPTLYKETDCYQIIIRDLTEQRRTEEMMHHTEKLSVAGQLAAGIAHEIRNPLTVIKGFAQLMSQEAQNSYTEVVLDELNRIDAIVGDLLILAKPQPSKMEPINIGPLVAGTVDLFHSEALLHNIVIKTEIEDPALPIIGEADKLKQVFINFIKNAIEAMPEGGNIFVYAFRAEKEIVITVKDTGIGIEQENLPHIGNPFFSTKEKGTGLGMLICNRIIKAHHGSLQIESLNGKGTTMTVRLPPAE